MTSDFGILVFSFFLAVGLVYIKGQEKIQRRFLSNVQVTVENLPSNMLLPPEPWLPPTSTVQIQGPRNFVDYVRADQTSFRISYENLPYSIEDFPVTVLLTNEMFKTNLEPDDRSKITAVEESIRPRQVLIEAVVWNLNETIPDVSKFTPEPNQLLIPILRVEKRIPVVVPREGQQPEGYQIKNIEIHPETIMITGRREAVDRIKSVSTTPLALEYLSTDEKPIILPLQGFEEMDVESVDDTIQNVTATVHLTRQSQ